MRRRGLLGALVMAFALGTATAAGDVAQMRFGASGIALQLVRAIVCSALAVSLIVLLRRKLDRRPMEGLGLPGLRDSARTFGLGVLLTGGAAVATFGLGGALGWVRVGAVSWSVLLAFIGVNTLVAFLYEALPEELTLRGYAYRNLNAKLRRWTAALWVTGLFLVVPALSSVFAAAVGAALGGPTRTPRLVPGGEDPVAYLILLTVFGAALIVARIVTGSVWAAIAVHLTFLTVNRLVLMRPEETGWSVGLTSPDAILLIPAYLLITAGLFLLLARWQGRRPGWRDRDPELDESGP
jgi:membrane protease YdiL (CAAX protease family)